MQHGTSDGDEPISDASQGSSMFMSPLAKRGILAFADRISLDGHSGPAAIPTIGHNPDIA